MRRANNVRLDGAVESCSILSKRDGLAVALLSVFTVDRRPDIPDEAPPSEKLDRMHHVVRLTATGSLAERVTSLPGELRSAGGLLFLPCHVEGRLRTEDSFGFVECASDGFSFSSVLKTHDNNRAEIVGKITGMTHSDRMATLTVDTGDGEVSTFFSRKSQPEAWDSVSVGNFRKGDAVELVGPLISKPYTDGRTERLSCMVSCHRIERVELGKSRKEGQKSQVSF